MAICDENKAYRLCFRSERVFFAVQDQEFLDKIQVSAGGEAEAVWHDLEEQLAGNYQG